MCITLEISDKLHGTQDLQVSIPYVMNGQEILFSINLEYILLNTQRDYKSHPMNYRDKIEFDRIIKNSFLSFLRKHGFDTFYLARILDLTIDQRDELTIR